MVCGASEDPGAAAVVLVGGLSVAWVKASAHLHSDVRLYAGGGEVAGDEEIMRTPLRNIAMGGSDGGQGKAVIGVEARWALDEEHV